MDVDVRWHHGHTLAAGAYINIQVKARRLAAYRTPLLSLGRTVESMLA